MSSSKEDFNELTQEDRRWNNTRSGDRHVRAKPYKRDKKRVDYAIDNEESEPGNVEIEAN